MVYLVYRAYDELENRPYVAKICSTRNKALAYIETQDNPAIFWICEHILD